MDNLLESLNSYLSGDADETAKAGVGHDLAEPSSEARALLDAIHGRAAQAFGAPALSRVVRTLHSEDPVGEAIDEAELYEDERAEPAVLLFVSEGQTQARTVDRRWLYWRRFVLVASLLFYVFACGWIVPFVFRKIATLDLDPVAESPKPKSFPGSDSSPSVGSKDQQTVHGFAEVTTPEPFDSSDESDPVMEPNELDGSHEAESIAETQGTELVEAAEQFLRSQGLRRNKSMYVLADEGEALRKAEELADCVTQFEAAQAICAGRAENTARINQIPAQIGFIDAEIDRLWIVFDSTPPGISERRAIRQDCLAQINDLRARKNALRLERETRLHDAVSPQVFQEEVNTRNQLGKSVIENARQLRPMIDSLGEKYKSLQESEEVKEALEQLKEGSRAPLRLGPSASFNKAAGRLHEVEKNYRIPRSTSAPQSKSSRREPKL